MKKSTITSLLGIALVGVAQAASAATVGDLANGVVNNVFSGVNNLITGGA
jgi:hypothetical protein